jgi:hypothetical protein
VAVPLEWAKVRASLFSAPRRWQGPNRLFARNDESLRRAQVLLAVVGRNGSMCRSDPLNRQSRPIGVVYGVCTQVVAGGQAGLDVCLPSLEILAVHQQQYICKMLRKFSELLTYS